MVGRITTGRAQVTEQQLLATEDITAADQPAERGVSDLALPAARVAYSLLDQYHLKVVPQHVLTISRDGVHLLLDRCAAVIGVSPTLVIMLDISLNAIELL